MMSRQQVMAAVIVVGRLNYPLRLSTFIVGTRKIITN